MNTLYFLDKRFESQSPFTPQTQSINMQLAFQFFAVLTIMFGFWYLHFRWSDSLNTEALWFAIPLAFAESMMFVGTILVM
ncbi:MAG: hypothetical protein JXQ76_12400, partial [Campylobacterales bacterium]|nr:hypothetical protein [Campylobacterales bacterium]